MPKIKLDLKTFLKEIKKKVLGIDFYLSLQPLFTI